MRHSVPITKVRRVTTSAGRKPSFTSDRFRKVRHDAYDNACSPPGRYGFAHNGGISTKWRRQ
jgi:hypothetical protein